MSIPKKCPYPGLRPYKEEEAIYFKGRDKHIRQITKKLEERKVLMITGASGDGKSSLVYAGLIPNARAGFFQAQFNNWLFVDFKPDRNPLRSFACALSSRLRIDPEETEEKLSYGFSSLVNLYKNSAYYIDETSEKWDNTSLEERKKLRNKSANLFILADQFEEIFTLSENYSSGTPSVNAYTVVNLLIETAKIANRDNLPVYIVFAMRSDFISHCVAFKGLPEIIGYSQFFVPRLKRNEIKQVIESPALLSGGKVADRLTEVLINELRDGFDRLPLLQHALHQLWMLADNGKNEIDLIHLAKLGGISSKYLSDENREKFNSWFEELPEYRKKYFKTPGLNNILNAHADSLYESAFDYFNEKAHWAPKTINAEEAKLIIKVAFLSLTRVDGSRIVRNRMSLKEITHSINRENINYETVCGVLNIFRLPDSTFIRPFINPEDIDTQFLSANTILDITHEALIRNWEILNDWEREEINNLNNFHEFNIQLERWVENDKSQFFLLTSGNLGHFEKWFEQCKPSPYWLLKYDESLKSREEKLKKAEQVTGDVEEYLKKSRIFFNRIENSIKRRKNIALITAVGVIVILLVIMSFAFKEKSKAERQEIFANEQRNLAQKEKIEADIERNKVILANKRAEKQRQLAEKNALYALKAKEASDRERRIAEKMRLLAEQNSLLANQEAEKALQEKQRADEQRSIAEIASDSAVKLTMLATAQSLAYKSIQNYNNKKLNLELAYKAYKLNKQFGGDPHDAAIYKGLVNSLLINDYNNIIYSSDHRILDIYINKKDEIFVYTDNNQYLIIYGTDFKQQGIKKLNGQNSVRYGSIYNDKILVLDENNSLNIIDSEQNTEINTDISQVNLFSTIITDKYMVNGLRNNAIEVYALANMDELPGTIYTESRVNRIINYKENFYAGLKDGRIIKLDIQNNAYSCIDTLKGRVSAMQISDDGEILICGSSLGEINLYSVNYDYKLIYSQLKEDLLIENIAISSDNSLLAVVSSDKIVSLYDLNNWNGKPIIIGLNYKKADIKEIAFNSKLQLIIRFSDNSIRYWETNIDSYAKLVKEYMTKP